MLTHKVPHGLRGVLMLTGAGILFGTMVPLFSGNALQGRIIEQPKKQTEWTMIGEAQVSSGATIPAKRHVFFRIPLAIDTISREILLGLRGNQVRYWGYCIPDENDPNNPPQTTGLPGKFFLSEAERAWRAADVIRKNPFTPLQPAAYRPQPHGAADLVRHQIDTFRGGMTCYIMSDHEIPIAADDDNDGINNKLEHQYGTDPGKPDTDGDALGDRAELQYGTDPVRRDTDGDGLIDGMEDANQNGRIDEGETNPTKRYTDEDTLCDGFCHEDQVRKTCKDNKGQQCVDIPFGMQMGEDRNLNGKVDKNESDPRKADTVGDGIRDDIRFFKCLAEGKTNC